MSRPSLPNVRSRRLGIELRRLRESADLTIQAASHRMERSIASISRIENGKVALPARDVALFLDTYGVTDKRLRQALTDLARDVLAKGWWQQYKDVLTAYPDFVSLEHDAVEVRSFDGLFVPGLLQTPAYVYALFERAWPGRTQRRLRRHVSFRMERQRILDRAAPPTLHFIVWEAALHARFGEDKAMREQYQRLCTAAQLPHVTLQVLPFTSGPPICDSGGFSLLWVPAFGDEPLIHGDVLAGDGFSDDPGAASRHMIMFSQLQRTALGEADSLDLIQRLASKLVGAKEESCESARDA